MQLESLLIFHAWLFPSIPWRLSASQTWWSRFGRSHSRIRAFIFRFRTKERKSVCGIRVWAYCGTPSPEISSVEALVSWVNAFGLRDLNKVQQSVEHATETHTRKRCRTKQEFWKMKTASLCHTLHWLLQAHQNPKARQVLISGQDLERSGQSLSSGPKKIFPQY